VPEFPRLRADDEGIATLPPPELGEHTLEVLNAAGLSQQDCATLLAVGGAQTLDPASFAWAPVRKETA
jgi:hypothetical protein